jgi:hypothetical protein
MSGSAARKIRQLIGYDKKKANYIQKKLYKSLKGRYLAVGAEEFWKSVEGRFNNK